jgi:IS5 family transposase
LLSEYETGLLGSVDAVLGRHQTKKGNQWYFGMKAHFGVDSRTKLIHAAVATPANVADSTVLPELLHLGIACLVGIFGRRRRIDDCRIDDRASGHFQSLRRQMPLHFVEQRLTQIVRFEQ